MGQQLHECSRERLAGQKQDASRIVGEMAQAIDPTISEELIREIWPEQIPLRRSQADFVIEELSELLS